MFEEEKLKKAQDADLMSIEEICSSTWEAVYRFIYYKVQNREEAEDITQETYVKALSHIQRNNTRIDKYISFLKTVSLNVLRDKWRKSKHCGTNVNYETIEWEITTVEDPIEANIQHELIKNALNMLSEEQRTVIDLRIIKGYSTIETAKIMNKKEGNIRVLQYRALQALAEILKNNE